MKWPASTKPQSNKLSKNMKLITKILPQRKKYEKISKTHRKMKKIKNTKILKI